MKENSREEDIEELKRLLYRNELSQYGKRKLINYYEQQEKDYKRVLKENEELIETYKSEKKMKNEYVKLYQDLLLKENVISVQKVKDKISERQFELQQEYKDFEDDAILTVLQELLEGRK